MSDRFFVPGKWQPGDVVELPAGEAQHAVSVMRLKVGAEVELFNGTGGSASARLTEVARRRVRVEVVAPWRQEAALTPRLIVAVAPPKGDRFRWMVEKLTELGVDRLIPLRTERSVVDPRDSKLEKLELNVVAACKQCGRNQLMAIEPVQPLSEALEQNGEHARFLFGHPVAEAINGAVLQAEPIARRVLLIGPEGGFSPGELELLASHGAQPVALGRHILRTETAAIALAAVLVSAQCDGNGGFGNCP